MRGCTHGMYRTLYCSSICETMSSGSCPMTLVAYTPLTYPSSRCHFATQLLLGSASVMRPSKTDDVQLSTCSSLPARPRNSSQLGHPSLLKRCTRKVSIRCRCNSRDTIRGCVEGLEVDVDVRFAPSRSSRPCMHATGASGLAEHSFVTSCLADKILSYGGVADPSVVGGKRICGKEVIVQRPLHWDLTIDWTKHCVGRQADSSGPPFSAYLPTQVSTRYFSTSAETHSHLLVARSVKY